MKSWKDIKRGDELYLLVPVFDGENYKYEYQKSTVINIIYYSSCINIRFKYTWQNNERKQINLWINKYKFDNTVLSVSEGTNCGKYKHKWGDLLVTYKNWQILIEEFKIMFTNKINKINKQILKLKNEENWLCNKGTIIKFK